MSFGALLRQFRVAAGLTQEALAERAGMSADGIGALERGTNQAPQRDTLRLLIEALNLDMEQERVLAALAIRSSRPRKHSRRQPAMHNLPRALTQLLGREREIEEVARLLSASPLVTLIGTGGVGKTRLAIGVGERLAESFRDGVSFIDLAPLQDPDRVASVVASKLGIRESLDRPVLETLIEALRHKQLLLILDNCEHLVTACAALADALVHGCDGILILATSRQPLDVSGEQTYRVASLAVPEDRESIPAAEALQYAAVALFEDRARRAVKSFCVTDENAAPISRICRRLDGIPFAIELAAARMKLMTPQQLEERLFERFDLLVGGSHLELPRHQTMRALIDWSYNLLTTEEQEFFTRLAVFTSDFSFDAVAFVCADASEPRTMKLLASLVDKSLVASEPRGATQRYRLLETLRAYASEHFSGDRFELDRRHAQYYAGLAKDIRPADVARLEPEGENLHAALDWALERRGDVGLGITLLVSMRDFWLRSGLVAEPAHRSERALAELRDLTPELEAALWGILASMRGELMVPAPALEAASKARDLFERIGNRKGLARALRDAGIARMRLADLSTAERDLTRAFEIDESIGDVDETARALGAIALICQFTNRLEESRSLLLRVLEMNRSERDDRATLVTLVNLAETEFALGETANAVAHARESLDSAMLRLNMRMRANQEANLAAYLLALGEENEARNVASRALRHALEFADHSVATNTLQHLAAIIARRDAHRAARLLGYVEAQLARSGYTREYSEQFTYDLMMNRLHDALSIDEISAFRREGASMSEEQAAQLAQHPRAPKSVGKRLLHGFPRIVADSQSPSSSAQNFPLGE